MLIVDLERCRTTNRDKFLKITLILPVYCILLVLQRLGGGTCRGSTQDADESLVHGVRDDGGAEQSHHSRVWVWEFCFWHFSTIPSDVTVNKYHFFITNENIVFTEDLGFHPSLSIPSLTHLTNVGLKQLCNTKWQIFWHILSLNFQQFY